MFAVTSKQTTVAGRDTRRELHVIGHQDADRAHRGHRIPGIPGVYPVAAAATNAIPQEALA